MANSLNKVQVIGNVGKQPEIRSFQNGGRIATFSVAVSERWKDKNSGEYKDKTEWVNVSVMNDNLVSIVEKHVAKGAKVYVEGAIETRKWQDKSGADRYSTEVVLRPFRGEIILLSAKEANTEAYSYDGDAGAQQQNSSIPADFDDEIPF